MRHAKTIVGGILLACGALAADITEWAINVPCELQTAGQQSLPDLTAMQGTTPLFAFVQRRSGREVDADTNAIAVMTIGPSATSDYYVAVTNTSTSGSAYYVQAPTLGTNTTDVADGWWYTVFFERDGYRFWTGAGRIDIIETTSTGADGLNWQTITQPNLLTYSNVVAAGGYRNPTYWYVVGDRVYRSGSPAITNENGDAVAVQYISGGTYTDWQMGIEYVRGWPTETPVWSITPDIGTIDDGGRVTTTHVGLAMVSAQINGATKRKPIALRYTQSEAYTAWTAGVSGTVRRATQESLDGAIEAAGGMYDYDYYSEVDHAAGTYTVNSNCWAADADLSGVAVATKHNGEAWGAARWHGTLITPRHIVLAKHTINGVPNQVASKSEEVGAMKRFVGRSGAVYERTVIDHLDPYGDPTPKDFTDWGIGQDTIIGVLDSAVPTNDVAVYSVLPADWEEYLPNGFSPAEWPAVSEGGAVCGLWFNQYLRVYGVEFSYIGGFRNYYHGSRQDVRQVAVAGDSGRPVFLWLPGGMVFHFAMSYPTAGSPFATHADFRSRVNSILAMDGERLTDVDLSGYTNFGEGE